MALIACRECGKGISSTAKVCPNCGVKKPAPKRPASNRKWFLIGIFLLIALILVPSREKNKAEQESGPDCQIARADGTKSERVCDLRKLCGERKGASDNAEYANMMVVDADPHDGDKLFRARERRNEAMQKLWGVDKQLEAYRPEDVARLCKTLVAPSAREIGLKKLYQTRGVCNAAPIELLETGRIYLAAELFSHIEKNCPDSVFQRDTKTPSEGYFNLSWGGGNYTVKVTQLGPDHGKDRYQIMSISSQ